MFSHLWSKHPLLGESGEADFAIRTSPSQDWRSAEVLEKMRRGINESLSSKIESNTTHLFTVGLRTRRQRTGQLNNHHVGSQTGKQRTLKFRFPLNDIIIVSSAGLPSVNALPTYLDQSTFGPCVLSLLPNVCRCFCLLFLFLCLFLCCCCCFLLLLFCCCFCLLISSVNPDPFHLNLRACAMDWRTRFAGSRGLWK